MMDLTIEKEKYSSRVRFLEDVVYQKNKICS